MRTNLELNTRLGSVLACLGVFCLAVRTAGCNSRSLTAPSAISQQPTAAFTLSGQVFDVTRDGRVPAADFPLWLVVKPRDGGLWPSEFRGTGPDGRYSFAQLPAGSAVVLETSATHQQVCGAAAVLGTATLVQLDLEVTSEANPQPSPTMPPLRVTGQVYETTPVGRVGVGGVEVWLEWQADTSFLVVRTDVDGRYVACGIPAGWPIEFSPWFQNHTYVELSRWYQFTADATVDFELKRR